MSRPERTAAVPPQQPEPGPRQARSRGHRRRPRRRRAGMATAGAAAFLLAAAGGWFAFGPQGSLLTPVPAAADGTGRSDTQAGAPHADAAVVRAENGEMAGGHTFSPPADRSERADGTVAALPGLGKAFRAKIPSATGQVLLVSGEGRGSADSTATLWTRTGAGRWKAGPTWSAHNALKGWTTDHHLDDLRSPIGVYSLSDAGGLKADPGTELPYHRDSSFVISGKGFEGEPLEGSFDYVVAIDYNRVAGTSPLDGTKPLGADRGGGIWVHVDHGGPTHACISLSEDNMVALLRDLDPAAHPVIVMGDRDSLAT
jgi:L,D-peptidoglycan transpeptidase YkuD (ErfK/YbiS/YcfS/YnhG family)